MASGVPMLDTVTRQCTVKKIWKYRFSIILTQGLNRQIRRMCEALGYEVKDLLRVRVMNITLDGLKDGQYRKLTDQELNELYDQLKDSSALPGGKYQEQWAATQDNRTRHGKGKKRWWMSRKQCITCENWWNFWTERDVLMSTKIQRSSATNILQI